MTEKEMLEMQIAALEEENLELKRKVEDLQKELEIKGYIKKDSEPLTISSYYLKKYLAVHNAVYQERLEDLDKKGKSLQNEYDNLMKQEDGLETIAFKNEESIKRIKEIDEIINQKYYDLEKTKYEFDSEVASVTKQEASSYHDTMNSLNEVLTIMEQNKDPFIISKVVTQVINASRMNIYPTNVIIGKNKYKLVNRLQDINELEQKVKIEVKSLNSEKKSLENAIQTISLETLEEMLDQLALEITKVNKSKEELEKLFKTIKGENLKALQDEINHFEVLEYSKKEIASKMDSLLQEYEEKIRTLDTKTNIELNKTIELSKLNTKKAELNELKKNYEIILGDYQQLDSIYQSVSSNINKLEEYLQYASKTINAKVEYTEFVNRYDGLNTTIKIVENEVLNASNKLKSLKDERKQKALDPYAKEVIQNLTTQIKKTEQLIEQYQEDIRNNKLELELMLQNEKNLKLVNILKDRTLIENKLPSLYNKQKELGISVNEKYQELRTLEKKLQDYDEIVEKIEALESEINN